MLQPKSSDSFLRQSLLGNALFSGGSAVLFWLFAPSVSAELGIPNSVWIYALALGLLGFALLIIYTQRLPSIPPVGVVLIIASDGCWVLGSIFLLWSKVLPLTSIGWWGVLLVAVVVGLFALLQTFGLLKSRGFSHVV